MQNATTEALLATLDRTGDACVRIMDMPEDQRRAKRGSKGDSPNAEQCGVLTAWCFVMAAQELIRRGVLPADWLQGVLD